MRWFSLSDEILTRYPFSWFLHISHGWWNTADDYRYDCNTKDDNRDSKLQLTSTIWSPATFLGCLDSLSHPNIGDGDGGVQPWQCWDFYHYLYRCHRGESLIDRISTFFLPFFCYNEKNTFQGDGDGDSLLPLALRCVPLPELERDPEPWVWPGVNVTKRVIVIVTLIICIPHICPYWYTTALFRPVKVHQKVRKSATK